MEGQSQYGPQKTMEMGMKQYYRNFSKIRRKTEQLPINLGEQ